MTPSPQNALLRLMVVEDEALIADELQHRLESLGHQVVAVCDTADSAVAAADSGFFTSPKDHERIFSGEARPMRMASKCSFGVNCLNRSSKDFMSNFLK